MTPASTLPSSEVLYNALLPNAETHLPNNPLFHTVPYDSKNPYHDINTTFVEAKSELTIEQVGNIAGVFYEKFRNEMVNPYKSDYKELELATSIMKDGKENIASVTGHESLTDVMQNCIADLVATVESGLMSYKEMIQKVETLISRVICAYYVGETPVIDILRQGGGLHLTLPMSLRILDAGVEKGQIGSYGRKVGVNLAPRSKFGRKICIAASGQSDDVKYGKDGEILEHYLQPVPKPNAKLLTKIRNARPCGIVMSGDKRCFVPMPMRVIETIADVDKMMHDIADVRQEATGIKTIYLRPDRD